MAQSTDLFKVKLITMARADPMVIPLLITSLRRIKNTFLFIKLSIKSLYYCISIIELLETHLEKIMRIK